MSKSTDGGATFSPLPPLPLDAIYAFTNALVIDPAEPARLYAATYAGVSALDQDDSPSQARARRGRPSSE